MRFILITICNTRGQNSIEPALPFPQKGLNVSVFSLLKNLFSLIHSKLSCKYRIKRCESH